MVRGAVVWLLLMIGVSPVTAATFQGSLVSRVPADTGGVYRRSVNSLLTVTLTYRNVGTNGWTATANQVGFVVVAAFDSNLTTPTSSPLASSWLTATSIASITPGTVSGIGANPNRETSILLRWIAPGDDGWHGRATAYDIRYSTSVLSSSTWATASVFAPTLSPAISGQPDSCWVTGLQTQTQYWFALKARDDQSNWASLSNIASYKTPTTFATVSVPLRMPSVPGRYSLTMALVLSPSNQIISDGLRLNFDVVGGSTPASSVDAVPIVGQFSRDMQADIGFWNRSNDEVRIAIADTLQRRFTAASPITWSTMHGADSLFVRQFSGDSLSDLCVHLPNGEWYVATNSGGTFTTSSTPFLRGFGVGRTPIAADFNADGLCDVGYFVPDSLAFFVALNRGGTRFETVTGPGTGGAWLVWNTAVPKPFIPLTGRFNADRYEDIGMRNIARAEWFVGMSNGAKFVASTGSQADGSWLASWPSISDVSPNLIARANADTLDDLVSVQPSGVVKVARSSGTGFVTLPDWLTGWSPDSLTRRSLLADVSGDRRVELLSYSMSTGRWYLARNTGSTFVPWLGTESDGSWISDFGRTGPLIGGPTLGVTNSGGRVVKVISRNPFVSSISLGGDIPEAGPVRIVVYDVGGRQVSQDQHEHRGGFWSWTWKPTGCPPGVYLIHCSFPQGSTTTRVVYLH